MWKKVKGQTAYNSKWQGRGFVHMSTFGGHFTRLAVISEQAFVRCREVAAIRRLEMHYSNSNLCISEWLLYGGVHYSECPLKEVPLYC